MSRRNPGKRGSAREFEQRVMAGSRCPDCGRIRFLTKQDAKASARRMKGREGRLNTYRCGNFWHLGHLPTDVIRGDLTRADIERRTRR